MLNSETTLTDVSEPEMSPGRPGAPLAASPSSTVFGRSLPPRGSGRHPPDWPPLRLPWVFFCGPPAPSSRRRRRSEDPGPVGGGERSGFAAGARVCTLPASARIPVLPPGGSGSYFASPVPIRSPQTENGPRGWRQEGRGMTCFSVLCMIFFSCFFFFFLNRRFISVQPRAPRAVRDSATTRPPRSFLGGETGGSHNSPRR